MNKREGRVSAGTFMQMDITETLSYDADDPTSDIYVFRPERTPLSVGEGHAELHIFTDDGDITVELGGEELDGLIDALHSVQQFHKEAE